MKLFFCQNDCPIRLGGHFGKRIASSLIYFLSYAYFDIQPSPNNYETPSTIIKWTPCATVPVGRFSELYEIFWSNHKGQYLIKLSALTFFFINLENGRQF